jgi:hypothetical protein
MSTYKKGTISSSLKCAVWSKYIGDEIGKTTCLCCNIRFIQQNDHHCGHVEAESKGGKTNIENLRPICAKCNLGMKTTNMIEYQKSQGFSPLIQFETKEEIKVIPESPKLLNPKFRINSSYISFIYHQYKHFVSSDEELQGYVLRLEKIGRKTFVIVVGKLPLEIFNSPSDNYKEFLEELTPEEILKLSDKFEFVYLGKSN